MAASYPTSIKSFTTKATNDIIEAAHINAMQDEITALQTELLTPGTWTPVLGGSGGTTGQSYSVQAGFYTQVGKTVFAWFGITFTAKGTITGDLRLSGLPVTIYANANYIPGGGVDLWTDLSTLVKVSVLGIQGTTTAAIYGAAAAAEDLTALTTTNLADTSVLHGVLIYRSS